MKHFKNVVFLLLFINQLMIVLCQTPIADGGTDTMDITSTYSKEYTFAYSSGDANHILHLTSATTDPAYPGYIYASCIQELFQKIIECSLAKNMTKMNYILI